MFFLRKNTLRTPPHAFGLEVVKIHDGGQKKEQTMVLGIVKEKLMLNPSFTLA